MQQIGEGQPIPADMMALDIGPKTIELFSEEISTRPHHRVERADGRVRGAGHSAKGTFKIAHAVADNARSHLDRRRRRLGRGRARRRTSPTRSRTSPPAAERRWNFWKARSCRAWKR